MIDQRLHALHEAYRVRHPSVSLERRLVVPTRMNVEEQRIANRPERVNAKAAGLLPRWSNNITQRFGNGELVAAPRMKPRKDEHHPGGARRSAHVPIVPDNRGVDSIIHYPG
jgi:hypothetical protein